MIVNDAEPVTKRESRHNRLSVIKTEPTTTNEKEEIDNKTTNTVIYTDRIFHIKLRITHEMLCSYATHICIELSYILTLNNPINFPLNKINSTI